MLDILKTSSLFMVIVHLGSGRDLKIRGYRCFSRWQKHVQKHSNNDFTENKLRYVFIQVVSTYTLLIYKKKNHISKLWCVCVFLYTTLHPIITNSYDDYISSSAIVCSNAIIFSETYKFDTVCLAGWSISSIRAITVCACHEMLLLPSNNSIKKIAFFQDLIATWRTDSIGLQRRRPEL